MRQVARVAVVLVGCVAAGRVVAGRVVESYGVAAAVAFSAAMIAIAVLIGEERP